MCCVLNNYIIVSLIYMNRFNWLFPSIFGLQFWMLLNVFITPLEKDANNIATYIY
jgi:hypothetical protein